METWVKLSTVVLLTAAAVAVSAPHLILDQPRERVEVPLGSSLTLSCSFRPETRVRVIWCFNRTRSSAQCPTADMCTNSSIYNNDKEPDHEKTWSYFNISNVTYNDSGWYFCKVTVEIPKLQQHCSNGTQVIIMPTSPTMPAVLYDWWLWVVVGVSSLILVVLIVVICVLLRRRQQRRKRDILCPIYANMHPVAKQPSPRLEMQLNSLKTVSPPKGLQTPSPVRIHGGRRSPKP